MGCGMSKAEGIMHLVYNGKHHKVTSHNTISKASFTLQSWKIHSSYESKLFECQCSL